MNVRHAFTAALFTACIAAAGSSQAASVTWDFEDVTFADGGTASGSFVFDASTDTFLSWSITTTPTTNLAADGGYGLNGATYTTNNLTNASQDYYLNPYGTEFKTANGTGVLGLNFGTTKNPIALTNAGGTVPLYGFENQNGGFESRSISGGYIESVSNVPLPGALPMFGAAILGLAGFGIMQSRKLQAA